jgi:hypothetical protein
MGSLSNSIDSPQPAVRLSPIFASRCVVADLRIEDAELVVSLSLLEKLGALRRDVRVPLSAVTAVRVSEDPWSELRGIRAPGTGFPGVISLCTRRGEGIRDFAAVYGHTPAVVVETRGADFDRLVISRNDVEEKVRVIQNHLTLAIGGS